MRILFCLLLSLAGPAFGYNAAVVPCPNSDPNNADKAEATKQIADMFSQTAALDTEEAGSVEGDAGEG